MNPTNPTIDAAASPTARLDEPGATIFVRHPDGPSTTAHTGSAHLELAVPIGDNTTFNVGSVAKQITAHLCIRAARDRVLALGRPVVDILPRFRISDVTIGELIQHLGGIRDAESLLSLVGFRDLDHYTAADLLQLAYRQQHRAVAPGRFLYSNTGYLLLAEILTRAYGAGLQEIAERQVFAPLGMTARFKTDPREVIPAAASSYRATSRGWRHEQHPVTLPGPGSLWCTAADLNRWLDHLWHIWDPSADNGLPSEQHLGYRPSDHPPYTYGAGLYADPRPGRTAVFHYGHEQGFSAASHLAGTGLRVICLSNHAGIAADRVAATVLADLAHTPGAGPAELISHALRTRSVPQPNPADNSDTEASHTSLGTYVCDDVPGTIRLTHAAGSLYLWRRGTSDRLTRTGPTTYAANGYMLTPPTSPADDRAPDLDSFVIDLDRAPGLRYRRAP
ncbi:beta-lactamase [Actinobacteria bacterium OK074]|nr:beta-lactamase [Actinobacteria bacterium OK074]